MASRGKYSAKDLKTKMKILEEVERGLIPKTEIAKKYNIKKGTLSTYLKNKESIIEAFQRRIRRPHIKGYGHQPIQR